MIKLKRLTICSIPPSINKGGEVQFFEKEVFIVQKKVTAVAPIILEKTIKDDWLDPKVREYCTDHNITLHTVYMDNQTTIHNVIWDNALEKLIQM